MSRSAHPLELSETEFSRSLTPAVKLGGRPGSVKIREVVNAIFYVGRTVCQ